MDKIIEVLVIDDNEGFATECVDFLKTTCNVGADMALTAEEAVDKLGSLPIKIILLDYDMPVNGLELFPRLKKIDPYVEIVFISAVATNEVLYESEKFPFAGKMAKGSCYNELPELIPTLLMRYAKDTCKPEEVFFTERKVNLFKHNKVEYSICSYQVIDKEYVLPESWHTTQMIHTGETLKHQEELNYEKIFDFTDNFKIDTDFNFELEKDVCAKLKTSLSSQLEKSINSKYSERIKVAINRIRELSLSQKEKGSDESIVARYYDFANVYLVLKLRINKHCTCCNSNTVILTTVYFPIPKVAYRIREYFDNREPKIIDSGFYETGFSAARLV